MPTQFRCFVSDKRNADALFVVQLVWLCLLIGGGCLALHTDLIAHTVTAGEESSALWNSWIRDIEIRHADSGLFIGGANVTTTDVVWRSDRQRDGGRNSTGHHGIVLGGTDQLLSHFDFRTKFIHDITVSRGSAGNVVHSGRGEDLTFDHHKHANHANLFTAIDAGVGTNIFESGGGGKLGRHCGAWTTWWNIRTLRPVAFPSGWATEMINIVGVSSESQSVIDAGGRWFEAVAPDQLRPVNLYESQLARRLEKAP